MRTTFSDIFTQGGQTQLHKFHMMRQVLGVTFKIALWIWLLSFIGLTFMTYTWHDIWLAFCYGKAHVRLTYFNMFPKEFWDSCWVMTLKTGVWQEVSDSEILRHARMIQFVHTFLSALLTKMIQAGGIALFCILALIGYWYRRGSHHQKTKVISGTSLVTPKQLARLIKKSGIDSPITLAGVPYVKNSETEHTLIAGTTGAGKTNAMNELLLQIREQNGKAVIVDTNGTFVERFFDSSCDIILNSFDARSSSWNLWKECDAEYMFDHFATCLIPSHNVDTFWTQAARTTFTVAAMRLKEERLTTHQHLIEVLLINDLKEVYSYFKKSVASSLMHPDSEKLAQSVRATLTSHIKGLSFIDDDMATSFSIRRWMTDEDKKGFLFLTSSPDQRATMTPLLTGWLGLAVKALMTEITPQKVWFFIDEMSSLHQIPDLSQLLAEIRKYGGCFVLGLQNLSQLDHIYGHHETRVICGLTGTKLIFRTTDTDTAKRMSPFLGEQEVLEQSESISFGAHQMRDGVNLSPHKKHQPLVPFSDLMKLSNLVAYLRLPRDLPLTVLTFDYHTLPIRHLAFVSKANTDNTTYAQTSEKDPSPSPDSTPLNAQEIHAPVDIQDETTASDDVKAPEAPHNPF